MPRLATGMLVACSVATLAVVVIITMRSLELLIVSQVCRDPPPPNSQHKWAVGSALLLVSFALFFVGLLSFLTFSGAGSYSWASP